MKFFAARKTLIILVFAALICIPTHARAADHGFFGNLFSARTVQANVSNFFNTISYNVYCGITGLFSDACDTEVDTPVVVDKVTPVTPVSPTPTPLVTQEQPTTTTPPVIRETIIEHVVERVTSPAQTIGITATFLENRIAELAAQLRSEMTDKTVTVRTSSGGDSISSRQIDSIYDSMSDNINDAVDGLQTADQVLALIAANGSSLPVGSAGYVLQATGTTTQWVATSTLGFAIPTTASTTEWTNKVSSQWATSGADISYMAGNVGIGTTTPSQKLHVVGNGLFSGTLTASNLSGTNTGDQDLSGFVPYTGATSDVDLGSFYFKTAGINDSSISNLSIDPNTRSLYDNTGTVVLSYSSSQGIYGGTSPNGFINLETGMLSSNSTTQINSLDYINRLLYDANGNQIADYSGNLAPGFDAPTLRTNSIFPSNNSYVSFGSAGDADVVLRALLDQDGYPSIQTQDRKLHDTTGNIVSSWGQGGYAFYASLDGSRSVYLDDGGYAINATGISQIVGTGGEYASFADGVAAGFFSSSDDSKQVNIATLTEAGNFTDGTNGVYLADGTYALKVFGNTDFQGSNVENIASITEIGNLSYLSSDVSIITNTLTDSAGVDSLDWGNRQLVANDGPTVILDWSTTGVAGFGANNVVTTGSGGFGTTIPARKLHVITSADEAPVRFEDASGYCEIDPVNTTWSCTSDERLKDNITDLASGDLLERMSQLRPVNFTWKNDNSDTERTGLIAQEVERIFPDLVNTDEETGMKSVSYGGFTVYFISAIKELAVKIAEFAESITTKQVRTQELCVGTEGNETCITKEQLDEVLEEIGGSSSPSPLPVPEPSGPAGGGSPDPEPQIPGEGDRQGSTGTTDPEPTNQPTEPNMTPINETPAPSADESTGNNTGDNTSTTNSSDGSSSNPSDGGSSDSSGSSDDSSGSSDSTASSV